MYKFLQRIVVLVFALFSSIQISAAASLPVWINKDVDLKPWSGSSHHLFKDPLEQTHNLMLTSEQLGLTGPVHLGVNYSDLTGAYLTAQYINHFSERWALGLIGEYGNGQYRYNGTLGLQISPKSYIKFSAERLNQLLPFTFATGSIDERVSQDALGARYQRVLEGDSLIRALDMGGYYAAAHNIGLAPIYFISNGLNCLGNPSGLACVNERNIAGGISSGLDLGFTSLVTPHTLIQSRLNYDNLHYSTIFGRSFYNRHGFGATFNLEQLLTQRFKFTGSLEFRAIYNTLNAGLSWIAPFTVPTELSLFAQRIVSKNATPNNNLVGLKMAYLGDGVRLKDKIYSLNSATFLSDLNAWVRDPAVKMNQVLAIAEEIVRLVAPSVQAINPNQGPLGGGNLVSIIGTNFNGNPPVVLVDGQPAMVQIISPTQLSITIPQASAAIYTQVQQGGQPVSVNLVVQNADGQSTTVMNGYTYTTQLVGPPKITALTPNQGSVDGNTLVRISGQNLDNASQILIGGVSVPIISNTGTQIEVLTPPHIAGTVAVTVTTPSGSYTFAGGFTYSPNLPEILSISPNVGAISGFTTTLITGNHLTGVNAIYFGGNAASSFTVNSDSSITAVTPAYSGGSLSVDVMISNGTSNATLPQGYTYQLAAPTISTVTPNQGPLGGGTTITVQGNNFAAGTTLTIGGAAATNISIINATTLVATTPAYSGGPLTQDVTVNNGAGSFTLNASYTYIAAAPQLNSLTPVSGSINGGTTVTLQGSNFITGMNVFFDGVAAPSVHVINANTATAISPAHAAGLISVSINNGSGTANLPNSFTYLNNAPVLTAISPNQGLTAGGTAITLTGSGLTGVTSVQIGGITASNIIVVNDTTITAATPAYVSGSLAVDVLVTDGSTNATLVNGFTYVAQAPNITSINPNTGSINGGITATLQGSNFVPGSTVTIGGVAATGINVLNANTLTLIIPPYNGGSLSKDVVINNGVANATLAGGFTYSVTAPTLSSLLPISGSIAGGTSVTLTGTGFTPGTLVTFGGIPALSVTVIDADTLIALTPPYIAGALAIDVTVNNGLSNATLTAAFSYQALAPTISTISPNSGSVAGGTVITLQGTNFVPGTLISVGGLPATNIQVINATTLTATVPAYVSGSLAKDIVVNNGVSSATLASGFTYTDNAPTLTQITPTTGSINGGTTVTLTGSGFSPGTSVSFGGTLASSVNIINANTLTAVTPAYTNGSLVVDVVVDNGVSNATLTGGFTYQAMAPSLNTITPNSGPLAGGTTITLNGSGFTPGTQVTIGSVPALSITVTNSTTLTAVVPTYISGNLAKDVTVDNGQGSATVNAGFTYVVSTPTLATVTPITGNTAGGTTITLLGSGFVPGSVVLVDGINAANVQVINSTTLTAVTPAHAAGAVDVTINNGAGSATLTNAFTYSNLAPVLSNINPAIGSTVGGTVITLTGSNLAGTTTVTVGGVPATGVTVINNNTVTAIIPPYISGSLVADITLGNGTANSTLLGGFTYQASAPTLNSITPNTSSVAGGISATLTGTNFIPGSIVLVGGIAASNVNLLNANTLTFTVPAYLSGSLTKDITINNGIGTANLAAAFTYTAVSPTIAAMVPAIGPLAGGTFITITGSGFTPGTTVSIGGIPATNITVNNANVITATIPAYISGPLSVALVVNNGVSNATLNNAFTYQPLAPTIQSIVPNFGATAGGNTVTITGTAFIPGTTVTIGGQLATNVNITNVSTLSAVVPEYITGLLIKDVSVHNSVGSATLTAGYTYTATAPTLTSLTPNVGSLFGGALVTVNGSGFTPSSTLSFGGVNATTVIFIDTHTLTALVPAYVSGPLAVDVVINNGVSNATLAGGFSYQVTSPIINNISPNSGTVNGGTQITLTGVGFVPGTTVSIGGIAAASVTVINATTLTAIVPAYTGGALAKDILVTNSAGSFTLFGGFTYVPITPTLTSISPNNGSVLGGTLVQLTGSGFTPDMSVLFDGASAANITVLSPTTATVVTPPHLDGNVDVAIINSTGSATLTAAYTYTTGVPTLAAIVPATGSVLGGATLTISGTNLVGVNAVFIGGVAATNVVVVNSSTVTATLPAYMSGTLIRDVVVSNGTTNATLTGGFTYLPIPPTVASISPASAAISGGVTATIQGNGFIPGAAVNIGGVAATNINVTDTNTLMFTVPAYLSGSLLKDVHVNNGVGIATLSNGFNYLANTPTVDGLSPVTGSILGGTLITVSGSEFTPGTTVSFGGILSLDTTVLSSTQLTALVPAYVSGPLSVSVTVDNGVGTVNLLNAFTYQPVAPTVTSITPNSGTTAGGNQVTIQGTGFTPTTLVSIGGIPATNIVITNSTTLTARIPAYLSGNLIKEVTVHNGLASATLNAAYTYIPSAPVLNTLVPTVGSISGGTLITLTGSGFTPNTTLQVGGVAATTVTIINANTLTAITPAYTGGPLNVDLIVDNGVATATLTAAFTYQAAAPIITTATPATGSMAGGTTVTLTGSGFVQGTTVSFGGQAAAAVTINSDTSLTAVTPVYLSGSLSKDITVNNGVGSFTLPLAFTYTPLVPTLNTVAPINVSVTGGTLITLTGTGFVPGTTVTIGGVSATNIQVLNANSLTAITPAHAAGSVTVTVNNGTGTASLNGAYTYTSNLLTLNAINPTSGSVAGGTLITINGDNLSAVTSVTIGGIPATNVSVLNSNTVTAIIPPYFNGALTADVTLTDGISNATLVQGFTYQASPPSIISITPNTGSVLGGVSAIISGTGFIPGTTVNIGGIPATTVNFINASTLSIVIPAYIDGALIKDVTLTNGVGTTILASGYIYTPVAPVLDSITPSSGPSAGGTIITLNGSGFTRSTTVSIGGYPATGINMINANTLTAIVPAYISGSLNAEVKVTNGISNASLPGAFTYQPSLPTISSITPEVGAMAGGTILFITGNNFTPATTVTIGNQPAVHVNVLNTTTLSVTTPAYIGGSLVKDISVTNEAGVTVLPSGFTYLVNAPTLISGNPNMGSIAGGTAVSLSGSNFTPNTTVYFGSLPALGVTVNSATSITAISPAYSGGSLSVDIQVNNGNSNALLANGFTYQSANPTISTLSPISGPLIGGTAVLINGSNFTPGTTVTFSGVPAAGVTIINATTLTALTPAYVSGDLLVDVAVNNGTATATLGAAFSYIALPPTLVSLNPSTGATSGGTTVTLTGSGFIPGTTVSFGGIAATNVQLLNASTLTAVTPAHVSGLVDVTVDNGISSASLLNAFTYDNLAPVLNNVSPLSGSVDGGTVITLTGANLLGVTSVTVGGVAATNVNVVNDTQLTATVPPYVEGLLTVDIGVSTGVANATLPAAFTYLPASPSLISAVPNTGSVNGGTLISLSGSHFIPGTTVSIGGNTATNITVINANLLTCIVPAYTSGALTKNIVVNNGAGSATLTGGFTYNAVAPTLNSISPTSGPVAGGTNISINGTGFTPATTISIGGIPATSVVVNSATNLTAVTPAYSSGSLAADVRVNNGVSNAVLNGAFIYQTAIPTISNLTPGSGSISGGTLLTIQGSHFTPTTSVTIGGVPATVVQVLNEGTLTVVTPTYMSGALVADVVVTNSAGSATLTGGFTYTATTPVLTNITPVSGSVSGGITIRLTGTGFTPTTIVTIGGQAATGVNVENSTTLTAVTPAYISGSLAATVVVNNGAGSASLIGAFTYIPGAPDITSITPATGSVLGGTIITINGDNFIPGTTVTIGGVAALSVTVVDASTLTVIVPPYVGGTLIKDVVVNNGVGSATLNGGFTYSAVLPTLTGVLPLSGSVAGGTNVTINGSNFTPDTTVSFGGVAATNVTIIDTHTLSVISPAYISGSLLVDITVSNSAGTATLTGGFTYLGIAPVINAITPNNGPTSGGTSIVITGSNFTPDSLVTINGIPVSNINVINATTINALTPAYVNGSLTADVAVNNGVAVVTSAGGFTYIPVAPTINSVLPTSGAISGGTLMSITGTGFVPGMTVTIGGAAATLVTVLSSTTLTALTPAHTSGLVDITLTNSAGSATLANAFTYITLAPTLGSIAPLVGNVTGGTSVTLTGVNLTGATAVSFGGIPASNVVVINDTTVTATVPAYVSGGLLVDVTLSNSNANATLAGAFTYQPVAPIISSAIPASGSIAGGTTVTLNGSGFVPGMVVTLGGIPATSVHVVNATTLNFTTPAYISGALTKDILVSNPAGSSTLTAGFNYTAIAPTLTGITSNTGPIAGGTIVTLSGSGFTPTTTVKVGGIPALSISILNANSLTAVIPPYINGPLAVDVIVNNGVSNAILNSGFTYLAAAPTILTVIPNLGSMNGGNTITITGTNFIPGTAVTVGGVAATNVAVIDVTTLTATVPAYVSGTLAVNVGVNNGIGSANLVGGYTYLAAVPLITSISPNSGSVAGGTDITVSGSGFTPTTLIQINGILATNIVVNNATSLTATTPAYVSGNLNAEVAVTNAAGTGSLSGGFIYQASSPTVSAIVPNIGGVAGGTLITLTGTNFTPNTSVTIGGISATSIHFLSSQALQVTIPAYISGPLIKDVVVSNDAGNTAVPGGFTYTAGAPTISTVSPNSGSVAGGNTITISGTDFTPGTTVQIGGVAATNLVINSASSITVTVPAYFSGALNADVVVNNGITNASLNGGYNYLPVTPSITSVSPNNGPLAGGTLITLTGSNFTPTTTLTIGGIAATVVTQVNANTLTAVIPAYVNGALAKNVVVTNSAGSATLTGGYTYNAPVPSLINVSPNTGTINGGTVVTLTGSGFIPGTTVTVGGIAAGSVTVINAATLTAIIPAYVSGSLIKNVVVNNGIGSATLLAGFTYIAVTPTLTSVTPNTGTLNGGTSITVTGSGFTPATTLSIGGIPVLGLSINSATSITATTPTYFSGALAATVVVQNEVGSASLNNGFTYQASTPSIISVLPNTGSLNGGTTVTLSGTQFTPNISVTIGGVAVTNINAINVNTVTATTPAYVSGALLKDVSVNNGVGTANLIGGFSYVAVPPIISSITPSSGNVSGGTLVTITGSGFTPGTTISFGGVAATSVNIVNATTLTVTVPAYVSGALTVDIIVNNGTGMATQVGGFTYVPVGPTITSIMPASGSIAGGTIVTINGTGFIPGMTVSLGGTAATAITVLNSTTLTALTPSHASGNVNVQVTNSTGSATLTGGFNYVTLAPTLWSISPAVGSVIGGTTVSLTGTNFIGTTSVLFGLIPTLFTVNSDTSITATAPTYVSGALQTDITVSNLAANATLTGAFTYQPVLPTITTLLPATGSIAGGTNITLTGTGFVTGMNVTVGGIAAANVTVVNATTLTFNTPAYLS